MATVQEPIETRRGLIRAREAVAALGPRGEWIAPAAVRAWLKKRDKAACSQTDAIEACREWRVALMARPVVQTVAKALAVMDAVELQKAGQLLRDELRLRAVMAARAAKAKKAGRA